MEQGRKWFTQEEGGPNLTVLRVLPRDARLITRSAHRHVVLERQFLDAVACSAEQWARSVRTAIVTCSARWSQVLVPTALKHAISWQLSSVMRDRTHIKPVRPSPPKFQNKKKRDEKQWDGKRFGPGSTTTTRAAARIAAKTGKSRQGRNEAELAQERDTKTRMSSLCVTLFFSQQMWHVAFRECTVRLNILHGRKTVLDILFM